MKANEAPEKIYLNWVNYPLEEMQVEYTRTDAFIEKACEFIRKGGNHSNAYIVTEFGEEVFDFVQLAEDLKNYMKGE